MSFLIVTLESQLIGTKKIEHIILGGVVTKCFLRGESTLTQSQPVAFINHSRSRSLLF